MKDEALTTDGCSANLTVERERAASQDSYSPRCMSDGGASGNVSPSTCHAANEPLKQSEEIRVIEIYGRAGSWTNHEVFFNV